MAKLKDLLSDSTQKWYRENFSGKPLRDLPPSQILQKIIQAVKKNEIAPQEAITLSFSLGYWLGNQVAEIGNWVNSRGEEMQDPLQ